MNEPTCCSKPTSEFSRKDYEQATHWTDESGLLRRCLLFLRWMFTGSIIILLPKCPFCLGAYIVMATGIGLSFAAASFIRILLIILCIVSLSAFVARRIYILYNKQKLQLSFGDHQYKINLLALKLALISSLYYLIYGA